MAGHRLREDDRGMTLLVKTVALLIVFGIVLGVYFSYFAYKPPAAGAAPRIVEMKDTVRISYIGSFEGGVVFDTSIKGVADDNATYPKALSFGWRASYSDFSFTVGKTDCSDGSSDCAIIGMSDGVVGLQEGMSTTATIPPDEGYGAKDQSLITVKSMTEQLPVREVMNVTAFQARFRTVPVDGSVVTDPSWGWLSRIHLTGGLVVVENSPDIARSYPLHVGSIHGGTWSVVVQSIDDGANNGTGVMTILDTFTFLGGNKLMVSETAGDFFVTENDDGTYTVDRNREVVGVNMVFRIAILQITKAS
jgi:FKBP-type peptidyl-prolyl cis-trans isomerase 2